MATNFKKPYGSNRPSRPASRPGARPSYGASSARPRSDGPVKLYDAVCSKCGTKCQVPFRPNGKMPVYCKECFGAPHDSKSYQGSRAAAPVAARFDAAKTQHSGEGKTIGDLTRQIAAMNAKIDTMLKILEDETR